MKRLPLVLFLALFCLPQSLEAASVGHPSDPAEPGGILFEIPGIGKNPLKTSFVYEYQFRELNPKINDPELWVNWYLAKIALSLFNRFEPYVEIGGADMRRRSPTLVSGIFLQDLFEFDGGFAWGMGLKIVLFEPKVFPAEEEGLRIFADTVFRRTRSHAVQYIGQEVTRGSVVLKVIEWQVAVGVSQKFQLGDKISFTPYLGGKYSDIDGIQKGTVFITDGTGVAGKERLHGVLRFGPFVGLEFQVGEILVLSFEGRFVDEYSVSAAATLRL